MTATAHLAGQPADAASGHATGASLTVTVTDECTVFSGLANVHRYDNPTAGEIVSYTRSVLGEHPQWEPIHLVADDATLAQLIQAFGDYEVELTCETLEGEKTTSAAGGVDTDTHPPTASWEEVRDISVRRPVVETRNHDRFGASGYVLVGLVVAVVVVCASAIWFVSGRNAGDGEDLASDVAAQERLNKAESAGPDELPALPSTGVDAHEPGEETGHQRVEKVTLEQDGLSVELPAGFGLEPDGDMWRATGPDPDFRLQLAVDPLYGVSPEDVMRQVEKDIEDDPELRLTESDGTSVHYEHDLPDGSHAQWSTWTDRDVQISIGCHTRRAPTTVQLATCTMANESARFTPPG